MENNLIERIILITAAEFNMATGRVTIVDENKQKYNFYKTKKDGSTTAAWNGFEKLANGGKDQHVGVSYVETDESFVNPKGETVAYKNRQIRLIKNPSEVKSYEASRQHRDMGLDMQLPNPAKSRPETKQVANTASVGRDYDLEAWMKCRHTFLVALVGRGMSLNKDMLKQAGEWADLSMTPKNNEVNTVTDIFGGHEIEQSETTTDRGTQWSSDKFNAEMEEFKITDVPF